MDWKLVRANCDGSCTKDNQPIAKTSKEAIDFLKVVEFQTVQITENEKILGIFKLVVDNTLVPYQLGICKQVFHIFSEIKAFKVQVIPNSILDCQNSHIELFTNIYNKGNVNGTIPKTALTYYILQASLIDMVIAQNSTSYSKIFGDHVVIKVNQIDPDKSIAKFTPNTRLTITFNKSVGSVDQENESECVTKTV